MKPTNENKSEDEKGILNLNNHHNSHLNSDAIDHIGHPSDAMDGKEVKKRGRKPKKDVNGPKKGHKMIKKPTKGKKGLKSIKIEEEERKRMEKIRSENPGVAADFIFKTMLERDPRKRRIKPAVDRILDMANVDTSSDDSDFDPGDDKKKKKGGKVMDTDDDDSDDDDIDEDDEDASQDDEDGDNRRDAENLSSDDEDYDFEGDKKGGKMKKKKKKFLKKEIGLKALFKDDSSMAESSSQDNSNFNRRRQQEQVNVLDPMAMNGPSAIDRNKLMKLMICAVCSGDVSYDSDEIIECDSCGISVHENCYGVTGSDTEEDIVNHSSASTGHGHGQEDASFDVRPVDLTMNSANNINNLITSPSTSQHPVHQQHLNRNRTLSSSSGHSSHHVSNSRTPPKGPPQNSPTKSTPSSSKSTPNSRRKQQFKDISSSSLQNRSGCIKDIDNVSTASSASTEPWFCDPCKSGLDPASINPTFDDSLICELCPNPGGIFKMTVTGRWVHVVCALYIPGVAFLDTNRLDGMTLFELPPEKYGSKYCSLCPDDRLARTGVTIQCDAGLCKTNFHVTCGQREGLLLEAQSLKETEMVDPFYAHCKLHSNPDKINVKKRRKNFHSLMTKIRILRSDLIDAAKERIKSGLNGNVSSVGLDGQRFLGRMNERSWLKLQVSKDKWYKRRHQYATRYWRPQNKVSRMLSTSSLAVRTLIKKTSFFGASLVHDVDQFEEEAIRKPNQGVLLMKETLKRSNPDTFTEYSIFDLNHGRKKMTSTPSFAPEFVNYYFDRDSRIDEMNSKVSTFKATNDTLKMEEENCRQSFEQVMKEYESIKNVSIKNRDKTRNIWNQLNKMLITHPLLVSPSSTSPTKITLCAKKYYPKVLESPIKPCSVSAPIKMVSKVSKVSNYQYLNPSTASNSGHHHQSSSRYLSVPSTSVGHQIHGPGHHSGHGHGHQQQQQQHQQPPTVLNTCGKCIKTNDQHLLALCDKCHCHYHLSCLDPPLTRMPKKSRFGGWQCSDCTEAQVELEAAEIANGSLDRRIDGAKAVVNNGSSLTKSLSESSSPSSASMKRRGGEGGDERSGRRLRKVPSKFSTPTNSASGQVSEDVSIVASVDKGHKKKKGVTMAMDGQQVATVDAQGFKLTASGKKRGRPLGTKNGMGIKKKDKPKKVYKKRKVSNVVVDTSSNVIDMDAGDNVGGGGDKDQLASEEPAKVKEERKRKVKKEKMDIEDKECCKCKSSSSIKILVECDNCHNLYHFSCLDPPLKKSPKARGYDWFCIDCDSSDEDEDSDDDEDEDGDKDGDKKKKDAKDGSSSGSSDSESDSSSSASSSIADGSDDDENGSESNDEDGDRKD